MLRLEVSGPDEDVLHAYCREVISMVSDQGTLDCFGVKAQYITASQTRLQDCFSCCFGYIVFLFCFEARINPIDWFSYFVVVIAHFHAKGRNSNFMNLRSWTWKGCKPTGPGC